MDSLHSARVPWWLGLEGLEPIPVPEWQSEAACSETATPDDWFAERGSPEAAKAMSICATCPVLATCSSDAIQRDEQHGIWAGRHFGDYRMCGNELHLLTEENTGIRTRPHGKTVYCKACKAAATAASRLRQQALKAA